MKKIFLILFYIPFLLYSNIDISKSDNQSILQFSNILITDKNISFDKIKTLPFKTYTKKHINLGAIKKAVWLQFTIHNSANKTVTKKLVISSPLIEELVLYGEKKKYSGILSMHKDSLYHTFTISLKPKQTQTFYLKATAHYSLFDFSLYLKDFNATINNNRDELLQNVFFLGVISALMIFSILIAIYLRDISFALYGLYLFAIMFQQISYTGLNRFIFSDNLLIFDLHISSIKVALLIITGSMFAISFLQLKKFPKLLKLYIFLIVVAILECLLKQDSAIGIYAPILTGAIFIIINLLSSIYVYFKGIKEARLYILGFSMVFLSYIFMIIDALGVVSIMEKYHNLLLISSSAEALFLLLAFADRYMILRKQKDDLSNKLISEVESRNREIEQEVIIKTKELSQALEEKELLLKELNHRVKNNLQIILSMINLQKSSIKTKEAKESCSKIEQRINAIAHTYSALVSGNRFKNVDMQKYLSGLLNDLENFFNNPNIKIVTEIDLNLQLKEAVYIGIIINELVTNSFKYAFEEDTKGDITIKLYSQNSKNILEVIDNGKGFDKTLNSKSLGLKLINILAKNQLNGKIILDTNNKTHCKIIF